MPELVINDLRKCYQRGTKPALDGFSYRFHTGVYGLLGPNGAGKTTLMNMIVGNLIPDQGMILYNGQEIHSLGGDYRRILGYMPQQQELYDSFTVKRFLFYFASLKGLDQKTAAKRITELLRLTGLYDSADTRLHALSGGMKQRVLLIQSLLNDPEILILDEPTAGLDPKERMTIRNYIYSISEHKTIILATHVISDVEQIAKEIIFLRKGETVLTGSAAKVIRSVASRVWETEVSKAAFQEIRKRYPASRVIGEIEDKVSVKIISEERPIIVNARPAAASLEDVYIDLYL